MTDLTAEDFEEFFQTLHDMAPFPWQSRLAKRVIERKSVPWPEAIALPTAAGKTACIDIAVFALACQADRTGRERTAPRRIFFVVDRRVIVDEAYRRATALAESLRTAKRGIVKEVADRLRSLAGGDDPLVCFQLRGGVYRDDAWARTPIQPTVVASTVDQIGSRLLFRGYGRSPRAWPIHAGLAGNDSLVLLDEAHCARPFLETLQAVAKYRQWADKPLPSPFHTVVLSATPPEGLTDVFKDDARDRAHPVLGARLRAEKPTALLVAAKSGNDKGLIEELAGQACALAGDGKLAIGILVNRVATARAVYERLKDTEHHDTVLLTGRMRPLDRDDVVAEWLEKLDARGAQGRRLDRPVFVVATQTLEVGANLDFDGMVSECASLDALRQRFGRLNRTGRDIPARGAVVIRAEQADDSNEDPVYGASLAETWKWLNKNARTPRQRKKPAPEVDMSVLAMVKLLPADGSKKARLLAQLNAPAAQAPVIFPAYVDQWVQTWPFPAPTPEPALFLHGTGRGTPDVQVCWRADLDPTQQFASEEQRREAWLEALAHCPPAAAECMPVPLHIVRRWLAGGDVAAHPVSDTESASAVEGPPSEEVAGRMVIRWVGRDATELTSDPSALRPGDVIVIPAGLGGWDSFGHVPEPLTGARVIDLGDRANLVARRRAVLRLHPSILAQWSESSPRDGLIALAQSSELEQRLAEPEELASQLRELLASLAEQESSPTWLRRMAEALSRDRKLQGGLESHPCGGLIVRGSRLFIPGENTDTFSDEDDATASGTTRVSLSAHSRGVALYAKRYAERCGLPRELAEDLELAAYCHDLGKADLRFQALLNGGSPWAAMLNGQLLAKSERIPQGRAAYDRARARSRYPRGARHELLSMRLIEGERALFAKAHDPELVLHLVASHHGFCRPFAPVVEDGAPVDVAFELDEHHFAASSATGLERLDSGVAERFWQLTRRYGWWGLAWLEATLRLADHRCSEAEAKAAGTGQEVGAAGVVV